jgi:hypothetical protein
MMRSLTDTYGIKHTHKTSMSCCLSITGSRSVSIYSSSHGYFFTIANITNRAREEVTTLYAGDKNHLASIGLSMAKHEPTHTSKGTCIYIYWTR